MRMLLTLLIARKVVCKFGLRFALAFLWVFLGVGAVLIIKLNFNFEYDFQHIFRVYPLISYMVMAMLVSVGLGTVLDYVMPQSLARFRQASLYGIGVLMIVVGLMSNWPVNNRRTYTWAEDYAAVMFQALEPNAVFFIKGDFI